MVSFGDPDDGADDHCDACGAAIYFDVGIGGGRCKSCGHSNDEGDTDARTTAEWIRDYRADCVNRINNLRKEIAVYEDHIKKIDSGRTDYENWDCWI